MEIIKEIEIGSFEVLNDEPFTIEEEFINRVKVLGIEEIEHLLNEDVKVIGRLDKYNFLALLRDVFLEFKKIGDTKIIVQEGTCGICGSTKPKKYTAIRSIKKVIELKGNNSNEKFHFAILDDDENQLRFRLCSGFIDCNGEKVENYSRHSDIYKFANDRKNELSGYK